MGFVLSAAFATPVADNRMAEAPAIKVFLSFISFSSVLFLLIDIHVLTNY
jgi:hypothetical protein